MDVLLLQQRRVARRLAVPVLRAGRRRERACPLDGTEIDRRTNGPDLAVHQTLVHGGAVRALRTRQDLDPVEGIGALLRF